jgi:hypothetical protein
MFTPIQPYGDSLPRSGLPKRTRYTQKPSANVKTQEKVVRLMKNTTTITTTITTDAQSILRVDFKADAATQSPRAPFLL